MSLIEKIKKNKKLKELVKEDVHSTTVDEFYHAGSISLNLLLSGRVNGGIPRGKVSMIAAPRAHFKTIIATVAAANAQKKGNVVIWIDAEFAFDTMTAEMFGLNINSESFILVQENSLEEIQTFIANISEDYNEKDDGKIFMVVDSLGTMITSKTMDDAIAGDDKTDMTVSKKKNNLSKILLRLSGLHKITIVLVNHVYAEMTAYSTGAISGGSGGQYVASSILKITSKAKDKDKEGGVEGNIFTAYTDKGRMARENSKLKFLASYNDGINMFYGILDDALEGGYVEKPSIGWYSRPGIDDKKFREADVYTIEFWKPIFTETNFRDYLDTKYSYNNLINENKKIYDTTYQLSGEV